MRCINEFNVPPFIYEFVVNKVNCIYLHYVPLEKNAKKALYFLREKGYKISIITSRNDSEIPYVISYLNKHNLDFIKVFNTNNSSKKNIIEIIKPLIFIDDSLHKLKQLFVLNSNTKLLFFKNISNLHNINEAIHLGFDICDWEYIINKFSMLY